MSYPERMREAEKDYAAENQRIVVSDAARQRNWDEHLASLREQRLTEKMLEPVLITRIAFPESNYVPPNPADASTGIPYRDVPPGKVFRSAGGFRGMKRANGQCVDHRNGGDVLLEEDRECWIIVVGGWIT